MRIVREVKDYNIKESLLRKFIFSKGLFNLHRQMIRTITNRITAKNIRIRNEMRRKYLRHIVSQMTPWERGSWEDLITTDKKRMLK